MLIRREISALTGINISECKKNIKSKLISQIQENGYIRQKIEYFSDDDKIPAYLLLPEKLENNPAVIINHQHNSERHFGKSEVCGLVGNPLQAFGPVLAKAGFVVLAPDTLCFEERRKDAVGTVPLANDMDFLHHLNEMSYRILTGNYLMKKVVEDAMCGVSLLSSFPFVDKKRIGTLGHSMGGNTAQFLAAMDERISYVCASGSACTYKNRMANGTGIELASIIPAFCKKYDIDDLFSLIAPRKLLIVSAEDDKYSKDAPYIAEKVAKVYADLGASDKFCHKRYSGRHPLTKERFDFIINWIKENSG